MATLAELAKRMKANMDTATERGAGTTTETIASLLDSAGVKDKVQQAYAEKTGATATDDTTAPTAPEVPEAAQTTYTPTVAKPEQTAYTPTVEKPEQTEYTSNVAAPEYTSIDYAKRLEELGGGQYTPSETVTAAQEYLNSIISSKPGTYQSKYGDQLEKLYNQIMNREDFSYDLNGDALYQQYKDRYIAQGQSAMRDATAQASALTGGYGNSYAATAGNLAYQNYLQQLNDVVPELYQQAYQRYLQEGEELQNQYAITQAADEAAYGRWRDSYNDWVNDRAYAQAAYESAYGLDYNDYTNRLNSAMNMLGMEQSDNAQANSNAFQKYLNDAANDRSDYEYSRDTAYNDYLTQLGYDRSDYEYNRDTAYNDYLTQLGYDRSDYEYNRDTARQDELLQQQYAREDKLTAEERDYNQSLIEAERAYESGMNDQSYYRDVVASIAQQGKLPPETLLGLAGLTTGEAEKLAKAYGYSGKGYGSSSSSSGSSGSSGSYSASGSTGSASGSTTGTNYSDILKWLMGQ